MTDKKSTIRQIWEGSLDEVEKQFLAGLLSEEEVKSELRGFFSEPLVEIMWGTLFDMRKHDIPYGGH